MNRPVAVTGAGGFVGQEVIRLLLARGLKVRAIRATVATDLPGSVDQVAVGPFGRRTEFAAALEGVAGVIHLAGVAHRRTTAATHVEVTVEGTRRLARAAATAGVRIVFASSIKASAERTHPGETLTELSKPEPKTPYGRAKLEAEGILHALSPDALCLRAPLVHAPNARANFARLLRLADSGYPVPVGGWINARSMISLRSFALALVAGHDADKSVRGAFFVSDMPALSIGQVIEVLREGLGRPPRVAPAFAPQLLQKIPLLSQVFGSLVADPSAFAHRARWEPCESRVELRTTAKHWAAARALR